MVKTHLAPNTLEARHIVVTRALHQADELATPLRALGAQVTILPTIGIAPADDPAPLRVAASRADEYDWILFTSVNAIAPFHNELARPAAGIKARIAAIGSATARAAETAGFAIALTPEQYVAESLLQSLKQLDVEGKRFLIPQAAIARDLVPVELRKRGAIVDVVEAYRNVIPPEAQTQADAIFQPPLPDWVLFASASAVNNLLSLIAVGTLAQVRIATIGPVASGAVRSYGLPVKVEAEPHTIEGLVNAVVTHCMP